MLKFIPTIVEKKTVKPVAAGGQGVHFLLNYSIAWLTLFSQAGGEKYVVQGIFFKFALGAIPVRLPVVINPSN